MAAKSSQYLRISDESGKTIIIPGECIDAEHYNEIDISDWNWNLSDPSVPKNKGKLNATSTGGAQASGHAPARSLSTASPGQSGDKIMPSRFGFSKPTDKSTAWLLSAMDRGEVFPRVKLSIQEEFHAQTDYEPFRMTIVLTNAFVVSVDWRTNAADARVDMEESWELNYEKIKFDYLYRGKEGQGWVPAVFDRPPEADEGSAEKSPLSASEQKAALKKNLEDMAKSSGWTPPGKR